MSFKLNEPARKVDDLQQMVYRIIDTWGDAPDFPQMKDYGVTKESLLSYLFDKQSVLDSMGSEKSHLTLLGIFVVTPIFIASLFPVSKLPFGRYVAIFFAIGGALLFGLVRLFMGFVIKQRLAKMHDEQHEQYIEQVVNYRSRK